MGYNVHLLMASWPLGNISAIFCPHNVPGLQGPVERSGGITFCKGELQVVCFQTAIIDFGRRILLLRVTVLVQQTAQPHIHSWVAMTQSKILRDRPLFGVPPLLVNAHLQSRSRPNLAPKCTEQRQENPALRSRHSKPSLSFSNEQRSSGTRCCRIDRSPRTDTLFS